VVRRLIINIARNFVLISLGMLEITNMAAMWNFEFVSGNFSIFEICSSGQKIEVFAAIKI